MEFVPLKFLTRLFGGVDQYQKTPTLLGMSQVLTG